MKHEPREKMTLQAMPPGIDIPDGKFTAIISLGCGGVMWVTFFYEQNNFSGQVACTSYHHIHQ